MPNLIHFFIHFDHSEFVKLFVVDRLPLVELLLNALVKVKVNDLVNHQDERPGKAALQLLPQKELPLELGFLALELLVVVEVSEVGVCFNEGSPL